MDLPHHVTIPTRRAMALAGCLLAAWAVGADAKATQVELAKIGLLADYGRTSPLAPGARIAMAAAFLGPVIFPTVAYQTHVQLLPVTNLLLYVVVWRTLALAQRADVAVAPAVVSPNLAG